MAVYEVGKLPEGEFREVNADYDIKKGDYYGFKIDSWLREDQYSALGYEEGIARTIWNQIREKGDKPIYLKVEVVWDPLYSMFKVTATGVAQRLRSATPIWLIILAIAGFLYAISHFITVAYYIFVKKEAPPGLIPRELIILIIILIILSLIRRR